MDDFSLRVAVEQPGRKLGDPTIGYIAWSGDPTRLGGAERRIHPVTKRLSLRREWFVHPARIKKMKTLRARNRARAINENVLAKLDKFYKKWKKLNWKNRTQRVATIKRVLAYHEDMRQRNKKAINRIKGLMRKDVKKLKVYLRKWGSEEGTVNLIKAGKARRKEEKAAWAIEKAKIVEKKRVAREEYEAEREHREAEAEASGKSVSPPPRMEVTDPGDMTGAYGKGVEEWQHLAGMLEALSEYENGIDGSVNSDDIPPNIIEMIEDCTRSLGVLKGIINFTDEEVEAVSNVGNLGELMTGASVIDNMHNKYLDLISDVERGLRVLRKGYPLRLEKYSLDLGSFIAGKLDGAGPATLIHKGYKIDNPSRLGMTVVREFTSGIDMMEEVFKRKGMLAFVRESLSQVIIRPLSHGASGLYYPQKKMIALYADSLIGGRTYNYLLDTLVHEFGHHVHMNYITNEARAKYDEPWAEIKGGVDSILDDAPNLLGSITKEITTSNQDRIRFFGMIQKKNGDFSKVRNSLKGKDKFKFMFWLHAAMVTKSPFRISLTEIGEGVHVYFSSPRIARMDDFAADKLSNHAGSISERDMSAYQYSEGLIKEWNEYRVITKEKTRWNMNLLGVGVYWGPDVHLELKDLGRLSKVMSPKEQKLIPLAQLPYDELYDYAFSEIRKTDRVNEMAEEYGLPTWYSRTDEFEDFAETFMWYILKPDKLKPKQIERMRECLRMSAEGGNEVFKRLAYRVASLFLQRKRRARL